MLRQKTFTGVRWTTFSSVGRSAMKLGQIVILTRLLSPSDFGLYALILALVSFLQIFADGGVSNAIIHYERISAKQLSSLFWLNVSISAGLGIGVASISTLVADWYKEPMLRNLLFASAASVVAGSFGQQLRVSAQKELRFSELAQVELGAASMEFIVAVALAYYGAGVYSLAAGGLLASMTASVLAWILLARGWRPQWRMRLGEIEPFLKYGGYMIGNNLATAFNNQIDVLLGSRLIGAQALGLYNVPKTLSLNIQMVINPIVTQVGLPVMARAQNDPALLRRLYLQTIRMTASVNFPAYVTMIFYAQEIVNLMLGAKWHSSALLLQILACWGLLRSVGNPVGSLLFSTGRAALAFKWNLSLLLFIGPTIWLGSQYGVHGIAIAMAGLMAVLVVPAWYFLIFPSCRAGLREYLIQLAVPLVLSVAAGVVSFAIVSFLNNSLARLLTGLVVGGVTYFALSWRFNVVWVLAMGEMAKLPRNTLEGLTRNRKGRLL